MANMRTTYKATVTPSATQLKPTQITARHATCMPRNGSTRAQSTRRVASRGDMTGGAALGREAKSVLSKNRDNYKATRSAGGTISFSGVILSFLERVAPLFVHPTVDGS
jgi:hypothetical protein